MILYAATVALGAFLLFLVEPLAARLLLPLFGGTSAVWLTSLLFFQVALLAGYLFADAAVRRLRPRAQTLAHLALLVVSALTLPFTLRGEPASQIPALLANASPIVQLLFLLARSVGLPFVALAATGPIAQALWSRHHAGSPYRLYALSNLASLLGLAAYPFLLEPRFTLHAQVRLFTAAFALFALAAGVLALRGLGPSASIKPDENSGSLMSGAQDFLIPFRDRALWLLLPACSSALLISITGHLTRNVAPIPLLWMLPLAAYLASFILCFDSPRWSGRAWLVPAAIVALALLAFADGWVPPDTHLAWSIAGLTAAFFVAVTALHGELVKLRPPAPGLTRFYLSLSLGGALGSITVAVLIPLLFDGLVELGLSLVAAALVLAFAWWPELKSRQRLSLVARAAVIIAIAVLCLSLFISDRTRARGDIFAARNFYGALHIQDSVGTHGNLRYLFNGNTIHGVERISPKPSSEPLAYYDADSGVGRAVARLRANGKPLRVGAIGLGAGVLAGDCLPGDSFEFYEINPLVIRIAREQFYFLAHCPNVDVRLGDARLLLAQESPRQFDLLVVDAFNSDSIPVHLLTAEAFALYARHLAPAGILAVHTSNRYLNLAPPIAAHAARFGFTGLVIGKSLQLDDIFPSEWVLLSRDPEALKGTAYFGARYEDLDDLKKVREWTDDYSNIAGAFR